MTYADRLRRKWNPDEMSNDAYRMRGVPVLGKALQFYDDLKQPVNNSFWEGQPALSDLPDEKRLEMMGTMLPVDSGGLAGMLAGIGAKTANKLALSGQPNLKGIDGGNVSIFRGSGNPGGKLAKSDLGAVFFSKDKSVSEGYGDVAEYTLPKSNLLDSNSKEAKFLIDDFIKVNPDEKQLKIIDIKNKIKKASDPNEEGTLSGLLEGIESDETSHLFLYPGKKWGDFISSKGYDGTSYGDEIAIHNDSAIDLINKNKPINMQELIEEYRKFPTHFGDLAKGLLE
jgi:hypothetical protein